MIPEQRWRLQKKRETIMLKMVKNSRVSSGFRRNVTNLSKRLTLGIVTCRISINMINCLIYPIILRLNLSHQRKMNILSRNLSRNHDYAVAIKAIFVVLFWSILFRCVSATDHTVGGEIGWDISSDVKSWASSTVFFTGDNLVFVYTPEHDVIEVEEQGYVRCQIRSPIRTYNDGDTVIPLMNPGTRYFVCGRPGHCSLGMKIQVDVLPRPQRVASSPSTEAGNSNTTAASPVGSGNRVEGPGVNPNQRRSAPPPENPPLPHLSDVQPPQSQENRNTTGRPSPNGASQRGVVLASWLGLCRFTVTTGGFFYSSFIAICYFALL